MTRYEVIQHIINMNKYESYLEIGVEGSECFDKIKCTKKVGVDPAGATFTMTSDQFFAQNKDKFDVIFIDGLHTFEQAQKDLTNSIHALSKYGTIVMHDCLPATEREQSSTVLYGEPWTGPVWKVFAWARQNILDASMFTVNTDHGMGVIHSNGNIRLDNHDHLYTDLPYSWTTFVAQKQELLNIISVDEFLKRDINYAC